MNVPVGIGIRADLDEETVYKITKTFWDNLDQVTSDAAWAKVTVGRELCCDEYWRHDNSSGCCTLLP